MRRSKEDHHEIPSSFPHLARGPDDPDPPHISVIHARGGLLAVAAAYLFILLVVLSPEHSWMQPELIPMKLHIRDHVPLSGSTVLRESLNYPVFEGHVPRLTRPVSSLFEILDTHFRMKLWEYMRPHPSLSLTMLMTLLLDPLLVYLLLRRMGVPSDTSLWAAAYFLLQPASLSLVAMLFRPAKALVNFLLLVSFWLATSPGHISRGRFAVLCGVVLFGFLCDETALVTFLALPLFFRERLFTSPARLVVYLLILPGVAVSYLFALPALAESAGFGWVNLSQYEYFSQSHFPHLRPASAMAAALMDLGLVFGESFGLQNISLVPARLKPLAILHAVMFLATLGALYRIHRSPRSEPRPDHTLLLRRAAAAITLFALLHAFLMQMSADRVTGRIWGPFWYGAFLPLFFTGAFAAADALLGPRVIRAVARFTLLAMLMISFPFINASQKLHHYYPHVPRLIEDVYSGLINRYEEEGPDVNTAAHLEEIHAASHGRGGARPEEIPRELFGVAIEAGIISAERPLYPEDCGEVMCR